MLVRILMRFIFDTIKKNDRLVGNWVVPTGDNKIGKLPEDHAEDS